MNSLLNVRLLLVTVTLISAAATPASAITRIGNAEAPQIKGCVCRGKVIPPRLCPLIHCTDDATFSAAEQPSNLLMARDWFGWERTPKSKRTPV